MSRSLAEQETILRWDRDEQVVHAYSAYPPDQKKLVRLGFTQQKGGQGEFYTIPLGRFRWGVKGKRKGGCPPREFQFKPKGPGKIGGLLA